MALPQNMAAKRALLIGSSYDNLPGTENDVNTVADLLRRHGFDVDNETYVKKLCGNDATRPKILDAWEELISNSSWDDVVIIYYSGHGGLAKSSGSDPSPQRPSRIQFLVPTDFDLNAEDWKGILDDEISQLLLRTTGKTTSC